MELSDSQCVEHSTSSKCFDFFSYSFHSALGLYFQDRLGPISWLSMSLHSSIPLAKTLGAVNHIPPLDGITLRPSSPDTCYRKEKVPYMSPTISSTKAAIFAPYGLPAGIFASLEIVFCSQPDFCRPYETWPVVLFSPGPEHHSSPILHAGTRNCKSGLYCYNFGSPI